MERTSIKFSHKKCDSPLVSVILPVYNMQKYLQECLDSIINQTLNDIEIICVNDGSTDDSEVILKGYASFDKRIKILNQENCGPGVARNEGLKIARGEYITFLDSDDIFDKNMLERLYRLAKENNLDIAVCRCEGFDSISRGKTNMRHSLNDALLPKPAKEVFRGRDIEKNYFRAFVWWPWDKLYKREYIESLELQFSSYRSTEDLYFVCIAVLMADRMAYIDDILVYHRLNVQSSVSMTRESSWNCFYLALLDLREFLVGHNLYERYEQDFVNYCLSFSLWHLDTMKGKSHCLLYEALRNGWYDNLKVTGHSEEYFYDRNQYARLCTILDENLETHLMNALDATKETLLDTKKKLQASLSREKALKGSVSFRVGRAITWGPRKVRGGVRRLL